MRKGWSILWTRSIKPRHFGLEFGDEISVSMNHYFIYSQQIGQLWNLTAFAFFTSLDQRRHDVEKISHNCIIRNSQRFRPPLNLYSPRFMCANPFHADDVLNRATDAERQIQLGCDSLPRRGRLAVMASHSRISRWGATRPGLRPLRNRPNCLASSNLLFFDPATYREQLSSACRQVHRRLVPLKLPAACCERRCSANFHVPPFEHGAHAGSCLGLVTANAPFWNVANHGASLVKLYVGCELCLKHLTGKNQFACSSYLDPMQSLITCAPMVRQLRQKSRT